MKTFPYPVIICIEAIYVVFEGYMSKWSCYHAGAIQNLPVSMQIIPVYIIV